MIEYIYFVKCPNCDDEHFYFFNEAKEFAMSCLDQKPVITQVEVNRNDFGECTDSSDLGTVWSWEEVMDKADDKPAASVFTKADLCDCSGDCKCGKHVDAEFDALGCELDEPVVEHINDRPAPVESDQELFGIDNAIVDCDVAKVITHSEDEKPLACKGTAVPANMSIKDLVEAMEENEDTIECACCQELFPKEDCFYDEERGWLCGDCEDSAVKCTWCDELYDRSECRKEVDLGWLCGHCEAAIKSRGEKLTFVEGSYWDLLDEKLDIDFSDCIGSSDMEIWGIKPTSESSYKAFLMKRYENVNLQDYDASQAVHDEMLGLDGLFVFTFDKDGVPVLSSWNPGQLRSIGGCEIVFDDVRYDAALEAHFNKGLTESTTKPETVELEYSNLEVLVQGPKRDVDDWDETYVDTDYTLTKDKSDVAYDIWENFITEEDVKNVPGGLEALEDDAAWEKFYTENWDTLFDKYYNELLKLYEDEAQEKYESETSWDDVMSRREKPWSLDEALEADKEHMSTCPECGKESYNMKEQYCSTCGLGL